MLPCADGTLVTIDRGCFPADAAAISEAWTGVVLTVAAGDRRLLAPGPPAEAPAEMFGTARSAQPLLDFCKRGGTLPPDAAYGAYEWDALRQCYDAALGWLAVPALAHQIERALAERAFDRVDWQAALQAIERAFAGCAFVRALRECAAHRLRAPREGPGEEDPSRRLAAWSKDCEALFMLCDDARRAWLVLNREVGRDSEHMIRSWAQLPEHADAHAFAAFACELTDEQEASLLGMAVREDRLRLDDPEGIFEGLLDLGAHRPGRWELVHADDVPAPRCFPALERVDVAVALWLRGDGPPTAGVGVYARNSLWRALFDAHRPPAARPNA